MMNAKMVLEIIGWFIIALVVFLLWYAFPIPLLRFGMVIFYIAFVRWIWRRGSK